MRNEKENDRSLVTSHSGMQHRSAIALLVTLFFIMAITVAVGVSLTQLQKGGKQLHEGRFLVQSSAVLEDVLAVLDSPLTSQINDADSLNIFLETASVIPFEVESLRVLIEMQSARAKFNINGLKDSAPYRDALRDYLLTYANNNGYNIDTDYLIELLLDCMSGKQDVYNTAIFDDMPWLYREKIANFAHFEQILEYYMRFSHDYSIQKIPWQELVRFDEHNSTEIDANYATAQMWQFMLPGADESRVQELEGGSGYKEESDLTLSPDEEIDMRRFKVEYFVPTIHVNVSIQEHNRSAQMAFEYNIKTKNTKEFEYGI